MKCNALLVALAAFAITSLPLCALATPDAAPDSSSLAASVSPDANANAPIPANSLETREFHLHNARLPGPFSAHQEVTAWQVTQGSWNGQSLDGLCLVLVRSTSDDGRALSQTNCYISDFATSAQRLALVNAFLATNPQALCSNNSSPLRLEPANITLQLDGQTVVLHLGLIA